MFTQVVQLCINTKAGVFKAVLSWKAAPMAWWWSFWSGRRGKLKRSSCSGKYDTVLTGTNSITIITTEKKHGKFVREADHHQVLCLAMCKYEIIILLKMSHYLMFLPQASGSLYAALLLMVKNNKKNVTLRVGMNMKVEFYYEFDSWIQRQRNGNRLLMGLNIFRNN